MMKQKMLLTIVAVLSLLGIGLIALAPVFEAYASSGTDAIVCDTVMP